MPEPPGWRSPLTDSAEQTAGERDSAAGAGSELARVFDSVAGGLVVLGIDGRVLAWNAHAETLLGVDGARVRRFDATDPGWKALHQEGSAFPFIMQAALSTLHTGEAVTNSVLGARKPDGSLAWLTVNARLVQGGDAPLGVVVSFLDITDLREAGVLPQARETQRDLTQRSPLAIISLDVDGTVQTWNPAATRIFGWSEREVLGRPNPLSGPNAERDIFALLEREGQGAQPGSAETRFYRKDGSVADVVVHSIPIHEAGTETSAGVIAMIADASQRKKAERALRESEERHRSLVEQLPLGTFIQAADGSFAPIYTSPQMQSLLDLRPMATFDDWLDQVYENDRERVRDEAMLAHDAELPRRSEYRMVDRHGRVRWVREESAPVGDAGGHPQFVQGFLLDITDQKAAAEVLERQAYFDPQTGLPNRTFLVEWLRGVIEDEETQAVVVMVVEVDRFRHLNNVLGRDAGDRLLRDTGERLRDAFGTEAAVARIGGAKFAIGQGLSVPGRYGEALATLMASMREPFTISRTPVRIGGRVGIATGTGPAVDASALIRQADIAASQAQDVGVPWAVYSPRHDRDRREELALAAELPEAIERDQLQLHYQPLLDLRTGEVPRFEALLRWRNPRAGLVGPDQFMPLVEETALIGPFTLWVVAAAVVQSRNWRAEGVETRIGVNISARNLDDPDFVREAAALIQRASATTASFGIEVTESALIANAPKAIESLEALKASGFRISIDDFGTGYSSLSYLQRLKVDEVKIDRSFIAAMGTDATALAIVRSITALGHDLGLLVVAEGVEEEATLTLAREIGIDYAQGHLLSPAMPGDEVVSWLRERVARQ